MSLSSFVRSWRGCWKRLPADWVAAGVRRTGRSRRMASELLEGRLALSGSAVFDVGEPTGGESLSVQTAAIAQPAGALTGKIVYTSAGHGWQWNSTLNRYATDRGDNNEIVEDFGNQDQLTFYADYLLRAGATVVPMRPVGHQTNEVVLDNDLTAVTYTGAWSNSSGSLYYDEDYGAVADAVHYRFASTTTGAETAVATYTPNIPVAGFYPIYTWVAAGTNRTDQLYRINDSGGVTEIRVDHSKVGNGWVYLGTYYFNAGSSATNGSVQISNQGAAGKVAIADTIRFGNGMGDFEDGPTISGYPREDENSYMWLSRAVGQGVSASSIIGTGNVSAPSLMAEYMNVNSNPFGTSVYIGFHSNAGGGRGAVGLITSSGATPNQASLALYTGRQINQDMQGLNGQFEYNWSTRTTHTYTDQFGEIDEGASAEMDMTIIEVGFHDSVEDAQLMRDPRVREQLARSTYEATLEYFDNFGGLTSPASQPSAPTNVRAISNANGDITVSWAAGPTGVLGGMPTGFRVYTSRNGLGFGEYVEVAGAGVTSYTFPAAQLDGDAYYFKVVAINSGGESPRSAVAGARRNEAGGTNPVLVVDGFDRFDRTQNVRYPYAFTGDGLVDRVWARSNNSFDYVVQAGEAIEAYQPTTGGALGFDFVQNEAIINGQVNLANYSAVVWLSGEESTTHDTFNATEQTKVEQYIAAGGHFFVSGGELGWDLDQQNNGRAFFEGTLKGNYVSDDAGTYNVTPVAGGIFADMSNLTFDNGTLLYDVNTPDVINPQAGAQAALTYSGGSGGNAAIQAVGTGGRGNVVMFGFPFETITTAARRNDVIDRVFDFFGLDTVPPNADFNNDGTVDASDYTIWRNSLGANVAPGDLGDADYNGQVNNDDYMLWRAQFGTSPGASAGVPAASAAEPQGAALEVEDAQGVSAPVVTSSSALSRRGTPLLNSDRVSSADELSRRRLGVLVALDLSSPAPGANIRDAGRPFDSLEEREAHERAFEQWEDRPGEFCTAGADVFHLAKLGEY